MTDGDTLYDENDGSKEPDDQLSFLGIGKYKKQWRWQSWNSTFDPVFRGVRIHMHPTGRRIFGDKHGLALFCAALAFFALYWRIGVIINDSYTVANGLVAVSEGRLNVERAVYGSGIETPFMTEIDGAWYARNYGQIVLALPFLWLVQVMALVADLRVALAGGWALLVVTLGLLVGQLLDREVWGWSSRSVGGYVGSAAAILSFVLIISGGTTIEPKWHHLMALQLQTMVAAGLVGVVIYRLLTRMYDRRVGLAAGALVVFASPITFWASFPKRHVLVALAVFVSIYCLYRSRETRTGESLLWQRTDPIWGRILRIWPATAWRAAAYVPVGLVTWVNPLEGFLLLAGLLVVDVPTGGRRVTSHVVSACTGLASLVPFFITNMLITGNPLESPMTYGKFGSEGVAGQGSGGGAGGGGGGGGGAGPSGGGAGEAVSSTPFDSFFGVLSVASDFVDQGVSVLTTDLDTVYYVFIYSGYVAELRDGGDAMRLSYLEAMPVAAVLIAIPFICLRFDVKRRLRSVVETRQLTPVRTVDAFVVVYALLVTLVYAPRLPMPAEITIRYLLVLFPLSAYGMMRIPAVRRVVHGQARLCCSAYLAGVLIGGQLLFLYMYVQGAVLDEAFQIHSFVGLGLATMIAGWMVSETFGYRNDRIGAVVLGLGAAASTVFVLVFVFWFGSDIGSLAVPFF